MTEEKQDRRVRRSKGLMRDALITLMNEKPFSEITAKEITEKADLNRATFYLHYNNLFGLLEELEDEVAEGFRQMLAETPIRAGEAWERLIIRHICDFIADNAALCRSLLAVQHNDGLAEKLIAIMKEKHEAVRRERGLAPETEQADLIHRFIAWGAIGMAAGWLSSGQPSEKEELVALAEKLVHPAFCVLLPEGTEET